MNREVLEERIAQGKRNRKEAGTKYGQWMQISSLSASTCSYAPGFRILMRRFGPDFLLRCASLCSFFIDLYFVRVGHL
jgi:hypothetical protein